MSRQIDNEVQVHSRKPRGKRRRPASRPSRRQKALDLGVEALENRLVPSAISLGTASPFNAFVLHDMKAAISDAEGRIAVGGNATFSSYGVGAKLANSHGLRDDLIVGGNLQFQNGQVFNGNIVYQGTASITSVGTPNGTVRQGSEIDFSAATAEMNARASSWAGMAANGTVSVNYGSLNMFGSDPTLNIFSLATSDLANASQINIDAPAGSDVLVNVSGSAGSLHDNATKVFGTDKSHVFFNFWNASTLDIHSVSVQGSVMAPYANVVFDNGNLEGTLVAGSMTGTGEFHITGPTAEPPAPGDPGPTMSDDCNALGVAADYNLFVFHNASGSYSDIEGRAAIGGNATYTGYGVGDHVSGSQVGGNILVVGGNLSFTNGQVYNGNVVYGGKANVSSFGVPNGMVQQGNPIDFAAAQATLTAASASFAGLAANGSVANSYGQFNLTGTDAHLNVFNLTTAQLASANYLNINAPSGSTVIVNVSGTSAQFHDFAINISGTDKSHVLFNFFQATTVQISGISVQGSVLAPLADVFFNNGNIEGVLVANNVSGTGEMHLVNPHIDICVTPTPTSSISGFVYVDANNNGIKESGEAGISGATVTLTGTDDLGGSVSMTTTTGVGGAYSFTNLRPGGYTITETQPAGYLDGKDTIGTPGGTTTNDKFSNVALNAGVNGVNNNFGELLSASIAGNVYYDADNDGVFDSGEIGLTGVTLTLSGTDDLGNAVNMATTTDAGGAYRFTNLRPGAYTITETQPLGYLDGKDTIGTPGGTTSNDKFSSIVLAPGVNGISNNFGELLPASIGGFVYRDANNDGIKQGDESGIPGTTVTISGTDDLGNPVNTSTTTDSSGAYQFDNLRPGNYTLTETQPVGYADGIDTVGTPGGTTSNDQFSNIVLNAGFSGANNNFGELAPTLADVSGYVYADANNDGIKQSGESGIADVTVTLGGAASATTTTDATGFYEFSNLDAGTYTITETQPAGYFDGKDTIGTQGGATSNDEFSTVVLSAGQVGLNNNFGELPPASVSGFVYLDGDNDGVKDGGESGISGVKITITGTNDLGNSVNLTLYTNAAGAYDSGDLRPGTYAITETQPAGLIDGKDTIGSQGGTTSNDQFTNVVLNFGVNGVNNNFGEFGPYVYTGQTATIGYWQNNNGQALINSFNGGSTATNLGNWLASTFPNVFGANAGMHNMAGKTNAEIAAYYDDLFHNGGSPKVEAQFMANAFAVYSTTQSLGDTNAAAYGFVVNNLGVGNSMFNVGPNGAAFGVANNSTISVLTILQYADSQSSGGVLYNGDTDLRNLAIEVFNGINVTGDIP